MFFSIPILHVALATNDRPFQLVMDEYQGFRKVTNLSHCFLFSDSLNNVQVTSSSPIPMPQMALGLIPTTNVTPPQPLSTEQINLQFQKKLEDLEQQVGGIK